MTSSTQLYIRLVFMCFSWSPLPRGRGGRVRGDGPDGNSQGRSGVLGRFRPGSEECRGFWAGSGRIFSFLLASCWPQEQLGLGTVSPRVLDCLVDSFWLIVFLVWLVVGPGGIREGPGRPRNLDGWPWGPPGGPRAPGARAQQHKNPYLSQGPFSAA